MTKATSLANIEKQQEQITNTIAQINDQQQKERELRQLVKNIQQELKRLKYSTLKINGSQNLATIKAIKAYQQAKEQIVNGYVSVDLYAQLQAEQKWPESAVIAAQLPLCTDCPEMVRIPGKNIAMSATEITYNQWQACENEGICSDSPSAKNNWGNGNRPVTFVNWDDTQQYIKWLSKKTGKNYRLPTENEWQYAAKGGSKQTYSWGNEIGVNKANCKGCNSQWDDSKTAPVKSFSPNAYGLYDMSGNVWEWTNTCLSYMPDCIIKGGAYNSKHQLIKLTYKDVDKNQEISKYEKAINIGFRVIRTN
ncbi:MAG: SUMF1/EgtB/PvdO family nonheme iron enzyme [Alcanivoracaceae bacterium]|nr:SUMF1/EgtB/PvdO family nonheme iron enzyme [Alcanivoracaceae bacterium]